MITGIILTLKVTVDFSELRWKPPKCTFLCKLTFLLIISLITRKHTLNTQNSFRKSLHYYRKRFTRRVKTVVWSNNFPWTKEATTIKHWDDGHYPLFTDHRDDLIHTRTVVWLYHMFLVCTIQTTEYFCCVVSLQFGQQCSTMSVV